MSTEKAIREITIQLGLPAGLQHAGMEWLVEQVNHLIVSDFNRLVSILYRLDISEKKITALLDHNQNEDAAVLIAGLMVERQVEKIRSRQQYGRRDNDIAEEEKW